jgi:hypothetical protein
MSEPTHESNSQNGAEILEPTGVAEAPSSTEQNTQDNTTAKETSDNEIIQTGFIPSDFNSTGFHPISSGFQGFQPVVNIDTRELYVAQMLLTCYT